METFNGAYPFHCQSVSTRPDDFRKDLQSLKRLGQKVLRVAVEELAEVLHLHGVVVPFGVVWPEGADHRLLVLEIEPVKHGAVTHEKVLDTTRKGLTKSLEIRLMVFLYHFCGLFTNDCAMSNV